MKRLVWSLIFIILSSSSFSKDLYYQSRQDENYLYIKRARPVRPKIKKLKKKYGEFYKIPSKLSSPPFPTVKFFDNPKLKGKPVIEKNDNALIAFGKTICQGDERLKTKKCKNENIIIDASTMMIRFDQISKKGILSVYDYSSATHLYADISWLSDVPYNDGRKGAGKNAFMGHRLRKKLDQLYEGKLKNKDIMWWEAHFSTKLLAEEFYKDKANAQVIKKLKAIQKKASKLSFDEMVKDDSINMETILNSLRTHPHRRTKFKFKKSFKKQDLTKIITKKEKKLVEKEIRKCGNTKGFGLRYSYEGARLYNNLTFNKIKYGKKKIKKITTCHFIISFKDKKNPKHKSYLNRLAYTKLRKIPPPAPIPTKLKGFKEFPKKVLFDL